MHSEATRHLRLDTQAKEVSANVREVNQQVKTFKTQDSDQTTGDLNLTIIPTWEGLNPPQLETNGAAVSGKDWDQLHKENKRHCHNLKATRDYTAQWTAFEGTGMPIAPTDHALRPPHRNSMCLMGQALQHPVASLLSNWAQLGCGTKTGHPWTKEQMWEAVEWGPHCSALTLNAVAHFAAEVVEKVLINQAQIVQWEDIKENPPK
jgi:hypothetical protein